MIGLKLRPLINKARKDVFYIRTVPSKFDMVCSKTLFLIEIFKLGLYIHIILKIFISFSESTSILKIDIFNLKIWNLSNHSLDLA